MWFQSATVFSDTPIGVRLGVGRAANATMIACGSVSRRRRALPPFASVTQTDQLAAFVQQQ
jgi:hypothetical protein